MTILSDMRRIPLSVPEISGNEWLYVKDCLDTNWVSSVGRYVTEFEDKMAEAVGTDHAVATVNGTAALHLALLACGVEPGDEVVTSDLTFIASANSIRYCSAWPVLVDSEPAHWQIDTGLVQNFLREQCQVVEGRLVNKGTRRRIAALLPVHVLGHPVDMDVLLDLGREFAIPVIEDASESLGATYKGRPTGSLGTAGCFSFNGNKLITTGGGGMITTRDAEIAAHTKYLSTQAKDDPTEYIHGCIGYNYRLTNVLAALGCAQLERLTEYVQRKLKIASTYRAELSELPGIGFQEVASWAASSHWLFTITVDGPQFGCDRTELMNHLGQLGIESRPLWQPMHQSPVHRECEIIGGEISRRLNSTALSIPCSVGLTEEDQHRVIAAIRQRGARHG
jgi:perosamine synthetase